MKTAKQLLIESLKAMGADGLCLILTSGEVDCGCGFDDFVPCYGDCTMCVPAIRHCNEYLPMEKEQ